MYNPYQPIGPDNQPDNTVQTGWTRLRRQSAVGIPGSPARRLCSLGRGPATAGAP